MMLLRCSTPPPPAAGIRPETTQAMAAMLTHGITPVVYEYGSLGCSGDLAPLAHCALAMMGEGTVRDATRPPAAETDTRQRLDQVVNTACQALPHGRRSRS